MTPARACFLSDSARWNYHYDKKSLFIILSKKKVFHGETIRSVLKSVFHGETIKNVFH